MTTRKRTVSMTPKRLTLYKNARSHAQKIVDVCDAILNNKATEAKACKGKNLQANVFRRFCKGVNTQRKRDGKVFITKDDWSDWREDLLLEITGESIPAPDDFDEILSDICKNNLTERQAKILQLHLDGCTYFDIGKELNVTRERVRQIEAKTIRILKKPNLRRRLEFGDEYMEALREKQDAQIQYDLEWLRVENAKKFERVKELDDVKMDTKNLESATDNLRAVVTPIIPDMMGTMAQTKLDKLGLSLRSYNCLKRHLWANKQIADPTAYDVSLLSKDELTHVQNLGRKSSEEIINKMSKLFGFTFA